MEIQVTKGNFNTPSDVVLHVDLQRDTGGYCSFMAALHEADKEGKPLPGNQIFYSSGAGEQNAQDTLTFVDFLLQFNDLPDLDLEMAEWLFEVTSIEADLEPGRYRIRYQVLGKIAYIQNPGQPEFGILPAHRPNSTNVVSI
tara:strand:+ start:123 stop:548 length:426 start_codon:yes stop_codon:yes gene_type:complete